MKKTFFILFTFPVFTSLEKAQISITNIVNESVNSLSYQLYQNCPNPFNPYTEIRFYIPQYSKVKLSIYNVTGRLINEPVNGFTTKGMHTVTFDGSSLSSGVYFYILTSYINEIETYKITKKMVVLK